MTVENFLIIICRKSKIKKSWSNSSFIKRHLQWQFVRFFKNHWNESWARISRQIHSIENVKWTWNNLDLAGKTLTFLSLRRFYVKSIWDLKMSKTVILTISFISETVGKTFDAFCEPKRSSDSPSFPETETNRDNEMRSFGGFFFQRHFKKELSVKWKRKVLEQSSFRL